MPTNRDEKSNNAPTENAQPDSCARALSGPANPGTLEKENESMLDPYYEDESVRLFHGDCLEITEWTSADVVITDPPYGFGSYATDVEMHSAVLKMCVEASTAAVFGYPELLVRWCITLGREPDEWVTWWPTTVRRGSVGSRLARESEAVAIFGPTHGERIMRPRAADQWSRDMAVSRGLDPEWARDGDVWRDPANGSALNHSLRLHPNEKPVTLMERLVQLCSDPGQTVADPFAGSGSTLLAARLAGRRSVGVEIDERYCEIAANRLSQSVLNFSAILEPRGAH